MDPQAAAPPGGKARHAVLFVHGSSSCQMDALNRQTGQKTIVWVDIGLPFYKTVNTKIFNYLTGRPDPETGEYLSYVDKYARVGSVPGIPGCKRLFEAPALEFILKRTKLNRYFEGIMTYLCAHCGYEEDVDMFAYTYDWRQSPGHYTVHRGLDEALDRAMAVTGGLKVDVIAHSLGCVVVDTYMRLYPSWHSKIRRYLTLAAPNDGAGGFLLSAIVTGYALKLPLSSLNARAMQACGGSTVYLNNSPSGDGVVERVQGDSGEGESGPDSSATPCVGARYARRDTASNPYICPLLYVKRRRAAGGRGGVGSGAPSAGSAAGGSAGKVDSAGSTGNAGSAGNEDVSASRPSAAADAVDRVGIYPDASSGVSTGASDSSSASIPTCQYTINLNPAVYGTEVPDAAYCILERLRDGVSVLGGDRERVESDLAKLVNGCRPGAASVQLSYWEPKAKLGGLRGVFKRRRAEAQAEAQGEGATAGQEGKDGKSGSVTPSAAPPAGASAAGPIPPAPSDASGVMVTKTISSGGKAWKNPVSLFEKDFMNPKNLPTLSDIFSRPTGREAGGAEEAAGAASSFASFSSLASMSSLNSLISSTGGGLSEPAGGVTPAPSSAQSSQASYASYFSSVSQVSQIPRAPQVSAAGAGECMPGFRASAAKGHVGDFSTGVPGTSGVSDVSGASGVAGASETTRQPGVEAPTPALSREPKPPRKSRWRWPRFGRDWDWECFASWGVDGPIQCPIDLPPERARRSMVLAHPNLRVDPQTGALQVVHPERLLPPRHLEAFLAGVRPSVSRTPAGEAGEAGEAGADPREQVYDVSSLNPDFFQGDERWKACPRLRDVVIFQTLLKEVCTRSEPLPDYLSVAGKAVRLGKVAKRITRRGNQSRAAPAAPASAKTEPGSAQAFSQTGSQMPSQAVSQAASQKRLVSDTPLSEDAPPEDTAAGLPSDPPAGQQGEGQAPVVPPLPLSKAADLRPLSQGSARGSGHGATHLSTCTGGRASARASVRRTRRTLSSRPPRPSEGDTGSAGVTGATGTAGAAETTGDAPIPRVSSSETWGAHELVSSPSESSSADGLDGADAENDGADILAAARGGESAETALDRFSRAAERLDGEEKQSAKARSRERRFAKLASLLPLAPWANPATLASLPQQSFLGLLPRIVGTGTLDSLLFAPHFPYWEDSLRVKAKPISYPEFDPQAAPDDPQYYRFMSIQGHGFETPLHTVYSKPVESYSELQDQQPNFLFVDGDSTVCLYSALSDGTPDCFVEDRVVLGGASHFKMLHDDRVWKLIGGFLRPESLSEPEEPQVEPAPPAGERN